MAIKIRLDGCSSIAADMTQSVYISIVLKCPGSVGLVRMQQPIDKRVRASNRVSWVSGQQ